MVNKQNNGGKKIPWRSHYCGGPEVGGARSYSHKDEHGNVVSILKGCYVETGIDDNPVLDDCPLGTTIGELDSSGNVVSTRTLQVEKIINGTRC
jgi:hypothetical protein